MRPKNLKQFEAFIAEAEALERLTESELNWASDFAIDWFSDELSLESIIKEYATDDDGE